MPEKQKIIDKKEIGNIRTIGSWNDNNCIIVEIDGIDYRLDVKNLKGILSKIKFTTEKKRIHTYIYPIIN